MGLFDKIFCGKKEEKKQVDLESLSKNYVSVKGNVSLLLKESNPADYMDEDEWLDEVRYMDANPDQDTRGFIGVDYCWNVEYVITDQNAFNDILAEQSAEEAIGDAFWMTLGDTKIISLKDLEMPSENYLDSYKTKFNNAYQDWGILCTAFEVIKFTADEESKEYCQAFKDAYL